MHGMILAGLIGTGGLLSLVSMIWLLVIGFQEHVLWGVAIFLVPGAGLVYGVMRWGKAQEALLIGVVGAMMMVTAALLPVFAPGVLL